MRAQITSALLLTLALGACATQQTPATGAPAAQPTASRAAATNKDDPDRVVCRDEPASPGSKITNHVCKPAKDWTDSQTDAKGRLREMQGRAVQPGSNPYLPGATVE